MWRDVLIAAVLILLTSGSHADTCGVKWPDGFFANLSCTPYYKQVWDLLEAGKWEPTTFRTFSLFLTRATSYIGFGSWVGPMLLYASQRSRQAFGCEPDPIAYEQLALGVSANPGYALSIRTFNQGMSDYDGSFTMAPRQQRGDSMSRVVSDPAKSRTARSRGPSKGRWKVKCMTLPSFIREHNIPPPYFVKVDTEGHEKVLIPSWYSWLSKRNFNITIFLSMHIFFTGAYSPKVNDQFRSVLRLFPHVYAVGDGAQYLKRVPTNTRFPLCSSCDYVLSDFLPTNALEYIAS